MSVDLPGKWSAVRSLKMDNAGEPLKKTSG